MPMTEAAIDSGLTRDLYVSLGEAASATALGRAHLPQAVRRLDLGRLPADGARRLRSPLSDRRYRALHAAAQRRRARRRSRAGAR